VKLQDARRWQLKTLQRALVCAFATSLTACSGHASTNGTAATIQELMATKVDPSADALWASVSTTITAAGTDEKQPRTDADWQAARHDATTLIAAANLLSQPKQRVVPPGHTTEDSTVPGIEVPANIQQSIDRDPGSFTGAALRLRDAGRGALAAIDQKSAQGLVTAGGDLDAACEACHLKYWYPHSPRPK
jgi:cytochrome c556